MVDKKKNTALDKIIAKRSTLPSELLQTRPFFEAAEQFYQCTHLMPL